MQTQICQRCGIRRRINYHEYCPECTEELRQERKMEKQREKDERFAVLVELSKTIDWNSK